MGDWRSFPRIPNSPALTQGVTHRAALTMCRYVRNLGSQNRTNSRVSCAELSLTQLVAESRSQPSPDCIKIQGGGLNNQKHGGIQSPSGCAPDRAFPVHPIGSSRPPPFFPAPLILREKIPKWTDRPTRSHSLTRSSMRSTLSSTAPSTPSKPACSRSRPVTLASLVRP